MDLWREDLRNHDYFRKELEKIETSNLLEFHLGDMLENIDDARASRDPVRVAAANATYKVFQNYCGFIQRAIKEWDGQR